MLEVCRPDLLVIRARHLFVDERMVLAMPVERQKEHIGSVVPNGSLTLTTTTTPGELSIHRLVIRGSNGAFLASIDLTTTGLQELRDLCAKALVLEQASLS